MDAVVKLLSTHEAKVALSYRLVWLLRFSRAKQPDCERLSRSRAFIGSLSMQRFWATDGNRKCAVFVFNLSSHYHIYIVKYLFTSSDNYFENLRNTPVLACEMFTSDCRPWLKSVACLRSPINSTAAQTVTAHILEVKSNVGLNPVLPRLFFIQHSDRKSVV